LGSSPRIFEFPPRLRLCLDDQRKYKERKSKERKRIESEGIVLVVWYKKKWNRKLKERKTHIY